MNEKVDELDLKIIRELQADARKSYRSIAVKLGVAEGTVYNRIDKLRRLEVIEGFAPVVNFLKLGYDLTAIIGVVVEGGHLPEIEERIARDDNVSAVYDVTGEYDVIVIGKFRDRKELDEFVKRVLSMPHVKHTNTMIALNVVKENHGIRI
jgi:Lrp/AsnC family transcriptional regulator for asnA, asnC and gidA